MEISIAQTLLIILFGFISFRIGYNTGKQEGSDYVQYVLETLDKYGVDLKEIMKKIEKEPSEKV